MQFRYSVYWLLLASLLMSSRASALVPDTSTTVVPPEIQDKYKIVRLFLEEVDRGKVVLFGRRFDRSMLNPTRIEYVYDLNTDIPEIRIYSEVTKPIAIPDIDTCELRAVSAVMSPTGKIITIRAHVWPK